MKRALILMALACGCQQRTELMVGLITDIGAPSPLDIAHLRVFPNGDTTQQPKIDTSWTLEPGFDKLPGSFGLNSGDGSSPTVEIVVTGERPGGPSGDNFIFVTRRARLTLVGGKVLFMRMALVGACMNRSDCSDSQTCREGMCVDKQVDGSTLPTFETSGSQVTAVECGASVFQDTATHGQIVGDGATGAGGGDTGAGGGGAPECNGGACIEGTCYLPPSGSGGGTETVDAGMNAAGRCVVDADCAKGGMLKCCNGACVDPGVMCTGSGGGTGGADLGIQQQLVIEPANPTVPVSGMVQLQAVHMPDGTDVTHQVQWFSSNNGVAMVATMPSPQAGLVSGLQPGVLTITARLQTQGLIAQTTVSVQ
jgi:hypothetical protein